MVDGQKQDLRIFQRSRSMKSAKIFLIGMYLYLAVSMFVFGGIVYLSMSGSKVLEAIPQEVLGIRVNLFYCAEIVAIQVFGWLCVGKAAKAYRKNQAEELCCSWKLLKLASIPFYIVNFLVCVFLTFVSGGLLLLIMIIPCIITCLMIVQSGIVGIYYIKYLRQQPENSGKPFGIHCALQLISVLDVVSTIIILKKYRISVARSLPS